MAGALTPALFSCTCCPCVPPRLGAAPDEQGGAGLLRPDSVSPVKVRGLASFLYFHCAWLSFVVLFPRLCLQNPSKVSDAWRILLDCLPGTSNSTVIKSPSHTPSTTSYFSKWQEHSSNAWGPNLGLAWAPTQSSFMSC